MPQLNTGMARKTPFKEFTSHTFVIFYHHIIQNASFHYVQSVSLIRLIYKGFGSFPGLSLQGTYVTDFSQSKIAFFLIFYLILARIKNPSDTTCMIGRATA